MPACIPYFATGLLIIVCVVGLAASSAVQEKSDPYLDVADKLLQKGMRELGAVAVALLAYVLAEEGTGGSSR